MVGILPDDLQGKEIELQSASGATVSGWHIRAEAEQGVVVLLHGVRANRLSMLERARFLRGHGYAIVTIDFQAHGESTGERITAGHLEKHDVRAAVDYAKAEYPGEPIGVIGVSLGGAAAILGSPLGIDALVLESVYPDIEQAIHNRVRHRLGWLSYIPAELLLLQMEKRFGIKSTELRPIDHIADTNCPVFVISGADDWHTTREETQQVFEVARHPKLLWIVDDTAHVDLHRAARAEYEEQLMAFLNRYLKP